MIAHVDADSFFASVLQRLHPHLRGRPLFALGMHGSFIIAASYEAKAKGVRTGMPIKEARHLCPEALEMPSDFRETGLASQQIEAVLQNVCPIIEQMSIDEWYLDLHTCVGGVPKDSEQFGRQLQKKILDDTGLSVSIGIAPTKLLAKLAGETRKPAGVTVVHQEQIGEFLKTRPLEAICGMGSRRSISAHGQGWRTAYDVAHARSDTLLSLYGRPGLDLQEELLGQIVDPVNGEEAPPKSISRCRSHRATKESGQLWGVLLEHLAITVQRMRRHSLSCGMVSVWLRDDKYAFHGKHLKMTLPATTEQELLPAVEHCWKRLLTVDQRYTQVGMALSNLSPMAATQYSLFESSKERDHEDALQETVDELRIRFGKGSIMRGAALKATDQTRPSFGMTVVGEN